MSRQPITNSKKEMFKHNTDRISTGLIDLRQFWHKDEAVDQFRISVTTDSVAQVLFTKTVNKFKREILFSVTLPTDKINFLLPVKYDAATGWDEPFYKLETCPKTVWDYPAYTQSELDLVFKNNNSYWKIVSIGFPDLKNRWEVPQFKIMTEDGDYRLSIYHSRSQTFVRSDELKDLSWNVSSYSQPIF